MRQVEAIQVGEELRLLLAEDSERLQELLSESLKSAGYRLDIVASVAELTSSAASVNYDLIIVDLGLPDGDGLAGIRAMRSAGISAPIVIITARGSIEDRITGLDSGADDYLIKPFNHIELLARVRALLRRPTELHATVLRKGKTELDETNEEVRCAGQPVDLRRSSTGRPEHRTSSFVSSSSVLPLRSTVACSSVGRRNSALTRASSSIWLNGLIR